MGLLRYFFSFKILTQIYYCFKNGIFSSFSISMSWSLSSNLLNPPKNIHCKWRSSTLYKKRQWTVRVKMLQWSMYLVWRLSSKGFPGPSRLLISLSPNLCCYWFSHPSSSSMWTPLNRFLLFFTTLPHWLFSALRPVLATVPRFSFNKIFFFLVWRNPSESWFSQPSPLFQIHLCQLSGSLHLQPEYPIS
jgi:hypothetical protein